MTPEEPSLLASVAEILDDMKAVDPAFLDLRSLTAMTDFFVIAHGTNERQVRATAEEVERRIKQSRGVLPKHVEGLKAAQWILMDYGDLVVHLFQEGQRRRYGLETIWTDAPRVDPATTDTD